MGLCLFPDDGDANGPDLSLSYSGFDRLRQRLARADGFELREMHGFRAGSRPWSEVSSVLEPLLNHPDDDGELSPDQCTAVLPRLAEIVQHWMTERGEDVLLQQHIEYAEQLAVVLRLCVDKQVALVFG